MISVASHTQHGPLVHVLHLSILAFHSISCPCNLVSSKQGMSNVGRPESWTPKAAGLVVGAIKAYSLPFVSYREISARGIDPEEPPQLPQVSVTAGADEDPCLLQVFTGVSWTDNWALWLWMNTHISTTTSMSPSSEWGASCVTTTLTMYMCVLIILCVWYQAVCLQVSGVSRSLFNPIVHAAIITVNSFGGCTRKGVNFIFA